MSEYLLHSQDGSAPGLESALSAQSEGLTLLEYSQKVADLGRDAVSVIVPTDHDGPVLPRFLDRLLPVMRGLGRPFEIIIVDDRSGDGTASYARSLAPDCQVRFFEKVGRQGRSTSLKEGVDQALGATIVFLDPELRYPPEAIPELLEALETCDVVVANRKHRRWLRIVANRLYRFVFGRLLLSVDADVRSGLKAFKRTLLESLRFDPEAELKWGFDAFLLYHARRAKWIVQTIDVAYAAGRSKEGFWSGVGLRLTFAFGVVGLRIAHVLRLLFPFLYPPEPVEYFNAGFTNVNDYLFLTPEQSAKGHITKETISLGIVLFACMFVAAGYLKFSLGIPLSRFFAGFISTVYIAILLFKLVMMHRSVAANRRIVTDDDLRALRDEELPVVSMFIPLYKEPEIIPQIFRYLSDFDYPQGKLDIIFILESTDTETAQAFLAMHPPAHFKALLSPDVPPKTKPKAMNVAFKEAKGEVLVIFDAEVLPERDQLKRAVAMFKKFPEAKYLHGRMDVYNAEENWITRLYTAEFCYFYHYFMPGLIESKYPVPISGHSTYFRAEVIEKVGAWDGYNVAEDCDIGIRIYRKGFGSGMMLDSHTWEQSTTTIPTWVRQRTRWIQGFIQTSMVQLRYPLLLKRELGSWRNFLVFLFLVPGNVLLNMLNIFQWILFVLWHTTHAPFLQVAYDGVVLYLATTCFLLGNFLFTYFTMYGLFARKHFRIVPWAVLSFVYWIMLGVATLRSTLHLFLHPHKWDKTKHFVAKSVPA